MRREAVGIKLVLGRRLPAGALTNRRPNAGWAHLNPPWKRVCSACKSSSDSGTFSLLADHQMLQVIQPVRCTPLLSISTSGCLHSVQVAGMAISDAGPSASSSCASAFPALFSLRPPARPCFRTYPSNELYGPENEIGTRTSQGQR